MASAGWDIQNKAPPQNDTELMLEFLQGEMKFNSTFKESVDKKGNKIIELIPTSYPEFNSKDLRTGAIDKGSAVMSAVNSSLALAQSINFLHTSTGADLLESYVYALQIAARHLGLSLSGNGVLLKELRGRRLIEEGVQKVIEKQEQQEQKKRFGIM